jgi:hypothetical protein
MKKFVLIAVASLGAFLSQVHASVTLDLLAGQLLTSSSAAIPNGALIQLIASTDGTFGTPSATSFTGSDADDVVIATISENSSTFESGGFSQTLHITLTGNGTAPDVGSLLELRWWPTLTTSSSAPGAGTQYGQFRTAAVENGSNIAWVMPADGSSDSLNFETQQVGGTEPNSAGIANMTVAAVPEPSTIACMLGAGALGATMIRRRRR